MKQRHRLTPNKRQAALFIILIISSATLIFYGMTLKIKTDTLNNQIHGIKEKLTMQIEQNRKLAAKIESQTSLQKVDLYATQKLKMARPETVKVIFIGPD